MKKVLLLAVVLMTAGLVTMAQTHPKKDTTSSKPTHMKGPKKTTDTTHHKKH